ncbi:uncharacterized protein LOC111347376 isoform X2 [Stylophora pistillata]|uniref:uncharacterized protein LOC111347376 isoform X2 n=1 Tax=Stylophora pistillata TaxID=50429 RepID=UPI000C0409D6|nr:uncharacterized protein LOC111347376 isoform X2 [Stylophora pistillata]
MYLKFVCLAAKEEVERPPISVKERTALAKAGFGDASITFGYNKSSVYNGIIQRFPQLSEVGGFYLLLFQRGIGEDAGFHRILPPRTPQRLKELCGQAKIFMRPVQKDIELDDKSGEERDADSDVPMINCFNCGAAIMMTDMQKQQETHQEGATKQPEDVFEFSADNDSNWEPPIMLQPSQPQKQQQDKVRGKHQESCSGEGRSNSWQQVKLSLMMTKRTR